MKDYFTYILLLVNGTHYTGITGDLKKRMQDHAAGRSISTRHKLPAKLIWLHAHIDRPLARSLEKKIKGTGAARFMKTYPNGNHGHILIDHCNKHFLRSKRSLV